MLPLVGAVAAVALVAPHPVRIAAINWTATPLKVASTASTVEVSQPHPACLVHLLSGALLLLLPPPALLLCLTPAYRRWT